MSLAQYIRGVADLTGTKVTILKLPNNKLSGKNMNIWFILFANNKCECDNVRYCKINKCELWGIIYKLNP